MSGASERFRFHGESVIWVFLFSSVPPLEKRKMLAG